MEVDTTLIEIKEPTPHGLSGLVNVGNTCFFNSALQCLSNTVPLTKYFLSGSYKDSLDESKIQKKLVRSYVNLLTNMWAPQNSSKVKVVNPSEFRNVFIAFIARFRGYAQQDSHECLIFLIETMHQALEEEVDINITGTPHTERDKMIHEAFKSWKNYLHSNKYSIFVDLFQGQLYSKVECLNCNTVSNTYDPFSYLQLPIPLDSKGSTSIFKCLDLYSKGETLDGDNSYYCDNCKARHQANKQITIWGSPKYLIIQLKRFLYGQMINGRSVSGKINGLVNAPIHNLDLRPYVDGVSPTKGLPIYDLYAVCNHSGGLSGGHYFAYCKNINDKWYNFNDSSVSEIAENTVISPSAYLLFYKRKN